MDCRKGEYSERRARGVCVICGRRPPTVLPDGTKMASCDECRENKTDTSEIRGPAKLASWRSALILL